jgi:hypothetical protein
MIEEKFECIDCHTEKDASEYYFLDKVNRLGEPYIWRDARCLDCKKIFTKSRRDGKRGGAPRPYTMRKERLLTLDPSETRTCKYCSEIVTTKRGVVCYKCIYDRARKSKTIHRGEYKKAKIFNRSEQQRRLYIQEDMVFTIDDCVSIIDAWAKRNYWVCIFDLLILIEVYNSFGGPLLTTNGKYPFKEFRVMWEYVRPKYEKIKTLNQVD